LEILEEDREQDKRDNKELLKSIFKLMYSGVFKSIYMSENIVLVMEAEWMSKMEDRMYNSQNCALEGQKLDWCTQCRGIYEAEVVLKENKDVL